MKKYYIIFISILVHNYSLSNEHKIPLCHAPIDTPTKLDKYNNFYQAGNFFFGGQPDDSTFQWFAENGVNIVFNLRTENEMSTLALQEDSLLQSLGIKYIHIPMSPRSGYNSSSVDTLAKYLENQEGKALIHCAGGGRVTLLFMAYLVRYRQYSLDDAIKIGKKMTFKFPLEDLLGKKVSMKVIQ